MSLREPSESKFSGTENIKHDLLDYEVDREVGRGSSSVVYSARCKSGRLRGRILAVKQISTSAVATVSPSTKIHRTLFHPSILSLLDTFATNHSRYQVLEYCANGNLLDRVRSSLTRSLSEPELRGVVRGLVDGLSYLRKELVIHCDINPRSILISETWRVKIAGFDLAVRVASEVVVMRRQDPRAHAAYRSPELVARGPYGFPTDIWSLGALVVACLTGEHAFDASSDEELDSRIVHADYSMPSNASYELQRLISRSLEVDPGKRISLQEISSHPFMESTLPVVSLNCNIPRLVSTKPTVINWSKPAATSKYPAYLSKFSSARTDDLLAAYERDSEKPCRPSFSGNQDLRITSMPASTSGSSADSTFSLLKREDLMIRRTASTSQLFNMTSQSTITQAQTPAFGGGSSSVSGFKTGTDKLAAFFQHRPSTLRVTSDSDSEDSLSDLGPSKFYAQPVEPPTPDFLTTNARIAQFRFDTKPSSLQGTPDPAAQSFKNCTGSSEMKGRPLVLPPSSPSLHDSTSSAKPTRSRSQPPISELPFPFPPTPRSFSKREEPPRNTLFAPETTKRKSCSSIPRPQWVPRVARPAVPPAVPPAPAAGPVTTVSDSTKPSKLNTNHLTPHTYKTVKGQVTILPSKSLLLDLREGERRKGKKGDEVLVISPNGDCVYVYSAPHLSTPCCLAEPSAEYTYDDLPREYWGRYADAVKAVYQVKQRVPKFVRYTPTAKCTLMANEPFGDVEVVISAEGKPKGPATTGTTMTKKLKLRLRQDKRTLEVTRHTVSPSAQITTKPAPNSSKSSTTTAATTKPAKTPQTRSVVHSSKATGGPNPEVPGTTNTVLSKKIVPVVRAGYEMELVDSTVLDEGEMCGVGVVREFLGVVRVVEGIQGVREGEGCGESKRGEKKEERIEDCVKGMESLSVDEGGETKRSFQPVGESEKAVVQASKTEHGWINRGDGSDVFRAGAIVVPGGRSQLRGPTKEFAGAVDTSGDGSGGLDSGYPDTEHELGKEGTCVLGVASRTAQDQGSGRPLMMPSGRASSWGSSSGLGTGVRSGSGRLARVVVPARPARFFSGSSWRSRSETSSSESGSSSEIKSRSTSEESL